MPLSPLPRIAPLLIAFAAACAFATAARAGSAPAPGVESPPASSDAARQTFERMLPNGMKVIVREDHRAPTVVHLVLYRVGSVDESKGRTGISHVLEHMMFKGTERYPAGEFSRLVAQLGGRENAFTTSDYTGYFQQIGAKHLGEMMKLEADRMSNLVLAQQEFDQEVRVVMEERRLRTEDRAQALVYEQFRAGAFVASPVRQPVIGWFSDLQALTVDDLRAWYEQWYTPSNATVIVVGDVSADDVWRLAEETYGQLKAHALPQRKPLDEPGQRGLRRAWVKAPAESSYVTMGFHVPRLSDVERDTEPYALEVLAAVLDADENGRLTRNIVRGSRVANQVGAGYDSLSRGPTLFVLDGTPAEGRTTADVEQALRDEVEKIARDGVAAEELERIKTQYVAGEIYKRDSIMAQAMEIGGLEMTGFTHRDADRILARIAAVTADEVQAVAKKYFASDDSLTIATLVPQPLPEGVRTGAQPPGDAKGGPIR